MLPVFSVFCYCFSGPPQPCYSEQQAEKTPCLSLSGRVTVADLSHVSVPSHSLEGLYAPRAIHIPSVGVLVAFAPL